MSLPPPQGGGGQGGAGGEGAGGANRTPPSGTWLTYGVGNDDLCELHVLDASDLERPVARLLSGMPQYPGERVWSPDGRALAYSYIEAGSTPDVEVLLATFEEAGLSENFSVVSASGQVDQFSDVFPAFYWSADSQSFAFATANWNKATMTWTPDESRVLAYRVNDGALWDVDLEPADTRPRIAAFSSDGTSLFFSHSERLYWASVSPDSIAGPIALGAGLLSHDSWGTPPPPSWLSDQSTFVGGSIAEELVAVRLGPAGPEVSSLNGSVPLGGLLFHGDPPPRYDFAVDQQEAGVIYRGANGGLLDVYWVSFQGGQPVDLSGPEGAADSFRMSPVGDAVVLFSEGDALLTVAHAGGAPAPRRVDLGTSDILSLEWSSDGRAILVKLSGPHEYWLIPYVPGPGTSHALGEPIRIGDDYEAWNVPGAKGLVTMEDQTWALRFVPFTADGLGPAVMLSAASGPPPPPQPWGDNAYVPCISPDGRGLLYLEDSDSQRSLYWASLDEPGSPPMLVVSRPELQAPASISADGSAYWIEAQTTNDLPRLLVGAIVDGSPTPPVEVTSALCAPAEWR